MLNQRGDFVRATTLLEQVVAARPGDPAFHVELGESYRNLGAFRDAIGSCLIGLRLRQDYPEGWNTLGLAVRGTGDVERVLEHFRQAISCRQDFFAAHVNAGEALKELGRLDEAIPHFERAVQLAPESDQARTSLGLALLDRGRNDEAVVHLEKAALLRPDSGSVHYNLGEALRLLGRMTDARSAYLKTIRLDPDSAAPYSRVGLTLCLEGRPREALRWYQLAVEMDSGNPELWKALADLHQKSDAPDEALICRQRVLEFSQADALDARIELGWALQEDGRHEEALEQYRRALGEQPDSARVHLALCGAYEELGDLEEAEARAREAIRLQPRFPAAYSRLATLLRGKCPDEDRRVIESLLSDSGLPPQPRAHLLFALAHVLDGVRDFARATSCLREANALMLEVRRAEGLVYHLEDHDQFVERLIRTFDEDFSRRVAGLGLETRRPIFVMGLPRSGTTLVEQILASHEKVYGAGERLFGRRMFEKLPAATGRREPPMECASHLDEFALKLLAGEHLGWLNALDLGRHERIVDKLPDNYLYFGLLAAMFPNATFIYCRRDLRDVAVSCWMSDFRSIRWANDVMHIGARFRNHRRIMDHWKQVFADRIIEIDYENTVSDLEGVARSLVEGSRLEWDPSCLEYHKTRRVVRTASLTQVRQPIYKTSVARWKSYEGELGELFAMLDGIQSAPPGRSTHFQRLVADSGEA